MESNWVKLAAIADASDVAAWLLETAQFGIIIHSCAREGDGLLITYSVASDATSDDAPTNASPVPTEALGGSSAASGPPGNKKFVPAHPEHAAIDGIPMSISRLAGPDLDESFFRTLQSLSPAPFPEEGVGDLLRARLKQKTDTFGVMLMAPPLDGGGRIAATASMLYEHKFSYGGGVVGHLEDVAVRRDWQGRGLGRLVVDYAVRRAWERGCRKIILDCRPQLEHFYSSLGFKTVGISMRIDAP